ncbi:hypothetical protein EJ08DRAFT_732287 [Tothia fuscella]|uniref:Chitin-binding type-2 domain-containing protein n=1 Tax=Tothia fuscella TaxID=1048955 RepID=A0A9P4U0J5_9PEZI|nr:hypothetical protein EJ08DRAFT_732287 [Tothia fuscella]
MASTKRNLCILVGFLQFFGAQSASVPKHSPQYPISVPVSSFKFADVCEGKEDGTFFPDPDNCQRFFVCYDGEGALASCLRRYCFNKDHDTCEPCAGCNTKVELERSPIEISISIN